MVLQYTAGTAIGEDTNIKGSALTSLEAIVGPVTLVSVDPDDPR